MAQSTILAPGDTNATSTDIEVAEGSTVTVGIYSEGPDGLPSGSRAAIVQDTPARDVLVTNLDSSHPSTQLYGPGTYRVVRPAGRDIGVFLESAGE